MKNEALQVPATNLLSREICSCFGNFAHPGNKNHQESLPLKQDPNPSRKCTETWLAKLHVNHAVLLIKQMDPDRFVNSEIVERTVGMFFLHQNRQFIPLLTEFPYGCFQKQGYPKMDGENNGKPYCLMDDLGGKPTIFGNTHMLPYCFPGVVTAQISASFFWKNPRPQMPVPQVSTSWKKVGGFEKRMVL